MIAPAIRCLVVALVFFTEPDAKVHELTGKVVHIADGKVDREESHA